MDSPLLVGLQYSRPDDQQINDQSIDTENDPLRSNISEGFSIGHKSANPLGYTAKGIPRGNTDCETLVSLEHYLHPNLRKKGSRRYRRSDDVYSLGVIIF